MDKKITGAKVIRELMKVVGYDLEEMGVNSVTGVTIDCDFDDVVNVSLRFQGRELPKCHTQK